MLFSLVLFSKVVAITTASAFANSSSIFKSSAFYHYDVDKALIGHVIKTLNKAFKPDCVTTCEETSICFSINFYKDQDGGHICDLNRSNKKQNPQSLVHKPGYLYADPTEISFCVKDQCGVKQALSNNWYKLGESSFKFFTERKSRSDSRQHCQSLGGDLASVTNELENQFLTDLFYSATTSTRSLIPFPGMLKALVMDGKDKDLSLYNGASIVTVDNMPALYLDGTDDSADVPRFEIRNSDLTIAVWIKTRVPNNFQIIFNDYDSSSPNLKAIRLYDYEKQLRLRMYFPSYTQHCYAGSDLPGNVWIHLTITWKKDHTSCKIYFNGRLNIENTGAYSTEAVHQTPSLKYIIGKKKTNDNFFNGWMRDFLFFSRVLTENEINEVKDSVLHSGAWIGLNDITTEGTLQWSDGLPLTYQPEGDLSNTADKDCSLMKEGSNNEVV